MQIVKLTADGAGEGIRLSERLNRVCVAASTWGGSTSVAIQYSPDGGEKVPFHQAFKADGTTAIVVTSASENVFDIPGDAKGKVRGLVSNYLGTVGLVMSVDTARTDAEDE